MRARILAGWTVLLMAVGGSRGAEGRPNILFLMPDQMRGQALGVMGNPDVRTPHLDALAGEGVLLRNTFANTPVCCPARAILLTGTFHSVEEYLKWARRAAPDEHRP